MQGKDLSITTVAFIVVRMYGLSELFMAVINSTYLAESYLKYHLLSPHDNWVIIRILMELTMALLLFQKTGWIIKLLHVGLTSIDKNHFGIIEESKNEITKIENKKD